MSKAPPVFLVLSALAALGAVSGCGGSSGYSSSPTVSTPPSALNIQLNTAIDPSPGQISSSVAVKGSVVHVGTDENLLNAIWSGSKKYFFYTDIYEAVLLSANADYAIGECASGAFVWPYRTNSRPTLVEGDTITAVSKNSDLFFDITYDTTDGTEVGNLLTVKGPKIARVAYHLPVIDFTSNVINGLAVVTNGTALLEVSAAEIFVDLKTAAGVKAAKNLTLQRLKVLRGSPALRLAQLKSHARSTTATEPSGYYIVSTKVSPIPLAIPAGSYGVVVGTMNDQGISVGGAYVGDPNSPNLVPYYWDAQGNPYPLAIPIDVTYGYAEDINGAGSIVGALSNDITEYAAMWNTGSSNPTNLNSLLPVNTLYVLEYAPSISDNFTIAAVGTPKANVNGMDYLSLQPSSQ